MTEPRTMSLISDSCTLPTVERPLRLAEFDGLYCAAVRAVRRVHPTRLELDLVPDPAVAARAAELGAREAACCSFFIFTLTIGAGSVVLTVVAPAAYADALAAIADRAEGLVVRPASQSA